MTESAIKARNAKNKKNKKNRKKNVALKLRKTKLGFIAITAIIIIISLVTVPALNNQREINKGNEKIAMLEKEYEHLRIKNDATQQKIDAPIDDDYIIEAARDNGYRSSDEMLFYLNNGD